MLSEFSLEDAGNRTKRFPSSKRSKTPSLNHPKRISESFASDAAIFSQALEAEIPDSSGSAGFGVIAGCGAGSGFSGVLRTGAAAGLATGFGIGSGFPP